MKHVGLLLGSVVAVAAVFYLSGRHDPDPEIARLKQQVQRLRESAIYDSVLVDEADRRAERFQAQRDSALEAAHAPVAASETDTDAAVAAVPDDTIRAAVEQAVASEREAHAQELQTVTRFYVKLDQYRQEQIASRDSLIADLRGQRDVQAELVQRLEDKLKPTIDLGFLKVDISCNAGPGLGVNPDGNVRPAVGVQCGVKL